MSITLRFDKPALKEYVYLIMPRAFTGPKRLLRSLVFFLAVILHAQDVAPVGQSAPSKKQANDYMRDVMLRNTNQLGLKEDPALTLLLKQPNVNWAIRASTRHILN